jgi:sensor c-di-GMP phosphodiesterase-like protein
MRGASRFSGPLYWELLAIKAMDNREKGGLVDRLNVAAATTAGVIGGFLLGCVLAIPFAESHLEKYLDRVAAQEGASINEAHDLLTVLQRSAYAPCSDPELNYFRELVFRSDSLKDAGRIHDGRIECSATAGRPAKAMGQFQAGATQADGTVAYSNLVPIHDASLKRAGMQLGNAFVVFSGHLPETEGALPMHVYVAPYTLTPANSVNGVAMDDTNETSRSGDTLAATHCSALQLTCVTATATVTDARLSQYPLIAGTAFSCGIVGSLLGMLICVLRRRSVSMERQLRRAIAQDQLKVVYQPIVNLDNGKITGAEVLARWTKEDGTEIGPDVFIKVAEEHGFVGEITRMVLLRSLADFGEVLRTTDFRLNINVTATDLCDPEFLPLLDRTVKQARVPAKRIVIEVTESATANQQDAMEAIRELRRMGHSIYIDDFGTGYSTLSYLLYLSVDAIKIDKAFTRTIGTEAVAGAILPQMMAMARSQNLGVVVEGIETEQQALYFSNDNKMLFGQGFLYGRPITSEEFFRLLDPKLGPVTIDAVADFEPQRAVRAVTAA